MNTSPYGATVLRYEYPFRVTTTGGRFFGPRAATTSAGTGIPVASFSSSFVIVVVNVIVIATCLMYSASGKQASDPTPAPPRPRCTPAGGLAQRTNARRRGSDGRSPGGSRA